MRFASARENALRRAGALTMSKAEACKKVKTISCYFRQKSRQVQLLAIRQIEQELNLILPNEKSRFQKQRSAILDLINQSHDHSAKQIC